jgi:stage IV sporulation protein FA
MFHEVERVKERRKERMERIRLQSRDGFSPFVDDWKDPINPDEELFTLSGRDDHPRTSSPSHEKWGLQILASLLLIGVAYVVFHTSLIPDAWKHSAREVMTRDFNFSGVADWYEARFGSLPTLLPNAPAPAVPAGARGEAIEWKLPSTWKVVKMYEPANGKVVLAMGSKEQVKIGETGWVTFVGEKPGYNTTVVVRLTKGREIWFGNLDGVNVSKDEVLQAGHTIGTARAVNETTRHLYLGVRAGEQFVNPLEVIPFE